MNDFNWQIIDLPHLNSIKLGNWALAGDDNSSCSLMMKGIIDMNRYWIDLNNLTSITSNGNSFKRPRSITLSSNVSNSWMN